MGIFRQRRLPDFVQAGSVSGMTIERLLSNRSIKQIA